jgi:hypothetical protein
MLEEDKKPISEEMQLWFAKLLQELIELRSSINSAESNLKWQLEKSEKLLHSSDQGAQHRVRQTISSLKKQLL